MSILAAGADWAAPPAVKPAWFDDPVLFARTCITFPPGEALTGYQADVLTHLAEGRRVAQRGPHGLGKTAVAAIAVHWFALGSDLAGIDWKVVTTAGVARQLEKYLWPEIHLWGRRLRWDLLGRGPYRPKHELLDMSLTLAHGEAFAASSDNASLIEGAHASRILYIFDEAKAITVDTFDAAEGAFSVGDAYALASSTPGAPAGRFYDIHRRLPGYEDWWTRHVTRGEVIEAGRMSPAWADQRRRQWGETSAIYQNRVEGEFAASEEDSVIPLAWIEEAVERWKAWDEAGRPEPAGRRVIGCDVAEKGEDQTVHATRTGNVVQDIERHRGQDPMVTAGQVAAKLRYPKAVAVVDAIGLGSGVVARLREQRLSVIAYSASGKSTSRDYTGEFGFVNQRAEQWWRMRERLDPAQHSDVCLPPDDELIGDLTAPRWTVTSGGKIQIEAKDDITKRIGRSTDVGDAVIHSFVANPYTAGADIPRAAAVPWTDVGGLYGAVPYQ